MTAWAFLFVTVKNRKAAVRDNPIGYVVTAAVFFYLFPRAAFSATGRSWGTYFDPATVVSPWFFLISGLSLVGSALSLWFAYRTYNSIK